MFRLFNKFFFLYSPDDNPASDNQPKSGDKDDVIKFMGEEDDTKEEPLDLTPKIKKEVKKDEIKEDVSNDDETNEDETEEPEEDDELEALIEETEEPSDEQLELTTPVRRREILKKYPELFKDFPYLEKAYYREQQYTELLPTINDAKEAVEKSQALDKFEVDLMGGDVGPILSAIRDESPNSFAKIVDNILPTIAKVDANAYHHILGNTIKHTIVSMVTEANKSNNDVLKSAAQILHQFVFGNSDFKPPSNLAKDEPKSDKPDKLSEREQEFNRRQFENARGDLNSRVNNALKSTIEANIDPKNTMTDYVRKQAIRDVSESLQSLIKQDKRFATITDRLWEDAFKNNFSKESVDRIRSAYLSKSKTLLPAVIKRARIEALRGMGKRVKEESEESTKQTTKPQSKERGDSKPVKKGEVPRGMRTLDFLMSD